MIFVDSADRTELSAALSYPFVGGFTTNPALFLRASGSASLSAADYVAMAQDLVSFADSRAAVRNFMIQGVGDAEQVLTQALTYIESLPEGLSKNLWIKLLPTREHLALCPRLASLGCKTLVTAIFTPIQAHAAMESGADGIAVYVGRLMNNDDLWERKLDSIARLILAREKMLLMASLGDLPKVEIALRYSGDFTAPLAVIEQLLDSPLSSAAIDGFNAQVAH